MKFYFPDNYGAVCDVNNDESRALQSAIDEAE